MSFFIAVIVLMCLGIIAGAGLAAANYFFGVREDPRIEMICETLPGANCGACGYPGCREYAKAVLAGVDICLCPAGGNETNQRIAEILGIDAEEMVARVAVVRCAGSSDVTRWRSEYRGINDCRAAQHVQAGPSACYRGCLGLGSCARVCPYDCIHVEKNVAVVNVERCTGCGLCLKECPRDIIGLIPKNLNVQVLCNTNQVGKTVRTFCKVGCIGCRLCEKNFPAFEIKGNLAHVDEKAGDEACEAAMICPPGAIVDMRKFTPRELVFDPEARKKLKSMQKEWKKERKKKPAEKETAS